jgi:hypothetical protein
MSDEFTGPNEHYHHQRSNWNHHHDHDYSSRVFQLPLANHGNSRGGGIGLDAPQIILGEEFRLTLPRLALVAALARRFLHGHPDCCHF